MEGIILYHITTCIVTIVPGALTLLYLVNTVLVSTSISVNLHAPASSVVVLHRNQPELTDLLAQVTYVPVRPRTLV